MIELSNADHRTRSTSSFGSVLDSSAAPCLVAMQDHLAAHATVAGRALSYPRSLSGGDRAHARLRERGVGILAPSVDRRIEMSEVPSPRPTDVPPPGRAIYLRSSPTPTFATPRVDAVRRTSRRPPGRSKGRAESSRPRSRSALVVSSSSAATEPRAPWSSRNASAKLRAMADRAWISGSNPAAGSSLVTGGVRLSGPEGGTPPVRGWVGSRGSLRGLMACCG